MIQKCSLIRLCKIQLTDIQAGFILKTIQFMEGERHLMKTNETPNKLLLDKYQQLKEYIKSLESVAVAFSSGVDSTFLL